MSTTPVRAIRLQTNNANIYLAIPDQIHQIVSLYLIDEAERDVDSIHLSLVNRTLSRVEGPDYSAP